MVVNLFATELARYAGIVGDPAAPAPYWSRGNARDEQPDGGAHGRASAARGRASRRLVRSGFARLRGGGLGGGGDPPRQRAAPARPGGPRAGPERRRRPAPRGR